MLVASENIGDSNNREGSNLPIIVGAAAGGAGALGAIILIAVLVNRNRRSKKEANLPGIPLDNIPEEVNGLG